jgi:predicted nucleotidyltransferase
MSGADVIDEIRDRVVRTVRPRRVILFGSRARGDARKDSDYDLLIVADTDRPTYEVRVDARVAMMDIPVSMDLIVLTPGEFEEELSWTSSVASTAVREGKVIYEATE